VYVVQELCIRISAKLDKPNTAARNPQPSTRNLQSPTYNLQPASLSSAGRDSLFLFYLSLTSRRLKLPISRSSAGLSQAGLVVWTKWEVVSL
jgi:hypothetical protein